MRQTMKIYMLAHFGDFSKKAVDGGQTSARRFLATLQKLGYEVNVTNRKSKNSGGALMAKLYAALWGIVAMTLFVLKLVFGNRTTSYTLGICYCGSMMPFDSALARLSKSLGYKHIMYIKGGRTKPQYDNGSKQYKRDFLTAIKSSNLILTEGEENIDLCHSLCKTPILYFPNYTEDGFAPATLPEKPMDRWNMIYFGRLCKEKNTILVVEIFNEVCKAHSNTCLTLVGTGKDEYVARLKNAISKSPYKANIMLHAVMKHDKLKECLRNQHFFIFPSVEPNEGHSNSMNEAMAWGVVPVVSNNNFLPSIVGNKHLVVEQPENPRLYASIVNDIIEKNRFGYLSDFVFKRVKSRFTQSVVENKLLNIVSHRETTVQLLTKKKY